VTRHRNRPSPCIQTLLFSSYGGDGYADASVHRPGSPAGHVPSERGIDAAAVAGGTSPSTFSERRWLWELDGTSGGRRCISSVGNSLFSTFVLYRTMPRGSQDTALTEILKKLWQREVGHFRKAESGYFLASAEGRDWSPTICCSLWNLRHGEFISPVLRFSRMKAGSSR
jgi:hypothetical protein